MKRVMLGALVVVGFVVAAVAVAQQHGESFPPRAAMPVPAVAGSGIIALSVGERGLLTVVDPRQRAVCVYHIDPVTGKITLKSARNIQWDLQITDLNNDKPTPQEIQSLLQQR
jgi:hypothetical protein